MVDKKCLKCLWYSPYYDCMLLRFTPDDGSFSITKEDLINDGLTCFEPLIPEVMEMTTCAVCGSTNVTVKAKLHSDLFTCNECGYEWRT
jgi:predicted RNA-binding Zn-ribbon protein involved in translation (DUF1610 family)